MPQPRALSRLNGATGIVFRDCDRQLDCAGFGPVWMRQPAVAYEVTETILAADEKRRLCRLHAFVVMPNHVHLLLTPLRPLCEVTKWIKGASARRANQLLQRTGMPFWQDESFDHWVRSQEEFAKIERYIAENPVRGGLVDEPSLWPWSSTGHHRLKARSTGQAQLIIRTV